jgi:hypothetical protein
MWNPRTIIAPENQIRIKKGGGQKSQKKKDNALGEWVVKKRNTLKKRHAPNIRMVGGRCLPDNPSGEGT